MPGGELAFRAGVTTSAVRYWEPRLSDAELVTLAVMQALLGYTSEAFELVI